MPQGRRLLDGPFNPVQGLELLVAAWLFVCTIRGIQTHIVPTIVSLPRTPLPQPLSPTLNIHLFETNRYHQNVCIFIHKNQNMKVCASIKQHLCLDIYFVSISPVILFFRTIVTYTTHTHHTHTDGGLSLSTFSLSRYILVWICELV